MKIKEFKCRKEEERRYNGTVWTDEKRKNTVIIHIAYFNFYATLRTYYVMSIYSPSYVYQDLYNLY